MDRRAGAGGRGGDAPGRRTLTPVRHTADPGIIGRVDPTDGTRRSYDAVAQDYAREITGELRGKPLDRAVLDAFAETVPAGPVADLGCGPGHVAAYLRARGLPMVGLDLSPAMGAVARHHAGLPVVAGDLAALPIRSAALAGAVCLYTVIHLDRERREAAYGELTRVLAPGGQALVSFHVGDAEIAPGESRTLSTWWGHDVDLTFRFLDPTAEAAALRRAGLAVAARVEREPYAGAEHPSPAVHPARDAPLTGRRAPRVIGCLSATWWTGSGWPTTIIRPTTPGTVTRPSSCCTAGRATGTTTATSSRW